MTNYAEIGALLRKARQDRRLDTLSISQAMHIRVRYIDALEEGNFGELPGPTYIKGYLLAYAGHLDLDKDEILRRFEAVQIEDARRNLYLPESVTKEKKPTRGIMWSGAGLAFFVYLVWAVFFKSGPAETPVVESVPVKVPAVVFTRLPLDSACFKAQGGLYPPCYNDVQAEAFERLPLPHPVVSMDLQ